MNILIVLQQMIVIAVLVCIGILMFRIGMIDRNVSRKLSAIIVNVCNPAVIISAILTGDIHASRRDLLTGLLTALILYAVLCVLGLLLPKLIRVQKSEERYYAMMTVYTNTGFMGIPIAQAVLNDNAMFYVVICNIMFSLYFYTHGIRTMRGGMRTSASGSAAGLLSSLKSILNPGVIASAAAIVIYLTNVPVPVVIGDSARYIGNAATFLSMSMLGASLVGQSVGKALKDISLWIFTAVRFVAFPAAMVAVFRLLHLDADMIRAYCLMMALPAANLPLIFAQKEGYPTQTLTRGILVTTSLSLITITLLMGLLF